MMFFEFGVQGFRFVLIGLVGLGRPVSGSGRAAV